MALLYSSKIIVYNYVSEFRESEAFIYTNQIFGKF